MTPRPLRNSNNPSSRSNRRARKTVFAFTPSTAARSRGRGEPFTWFRFTICDRAADFDGDPLVEGERVAIVLRLDPLHDAKYLSTIFREVDMTFVDSEPIVRAEDQHALIEEAKRHRRHRRWITAWVLASVVAVSVGVYAGVSWSTGGGSSNGTPPASTHSLVGLIATTNAYRECPGSARVGSATSPDGLPALASRTNDLSFVVSVAQTMARGPFLGFTHRIAQLPRRSAVKDVRVGPGGGYVWTRASSGQIKVEHAKNYGIYVYLRSTSQCPVGGWARLVDSGVQVTFLAPTS